MTDGKPMEHLIFASYGNDSIALIQWAHEHGLPGVHVAYGDTGWAAEWWPARVEQAESWVRTLGFVPHRIKGEAMGSLVMRKKAKTPEDALAESVGTE